jgi:hypothetical protein
MKRADIRADIAVYGLDRRLQLVVEVKNRLNASVEWATRMRENLLSYSAIPNAPYFLLALPDFFYLWKEAASTTDGQPDYKIEAKEALSSYVDESIRPLNDVSKYGLEILVASWLDGLVNSELTKDTSDPSLHWLFDSGLYEAIKNGSVDVEASI